MTTLATELPAVPPTAPWPYVIVVALVLLLLIAAAGAAAGTWRGKP